MVVRLSLAEVEEMGGSRNGMLCDLLDIPNSVTFSLSILRN